MISNNECARYDERLHPAGALASPKLEEAKAIRKLEAAIEGDLAKMLLYGSVKGETLVWHFSHPAAMMSWATERKAIVERMRTIYKEEGLGRIIRFRRVDAKVLPVRMEPPRQEEPRPESATGHFAIPQSMPPELRRRFENIARAIRENNTTTKEQQ
jgi:hypothetical protein